MGIKTIADLVKKEQLKQIKVTRALPKQAPQVPNRLVADEFLGRKDAKIAVNTTKQKPSPEALTKREILGANSFVKPPKQFSTPTLLKGIGEVAQAHTTLAQAQVEAQKINDLSEVSSKPIQSLVQHNRSNTFSNIPTTIKNLLA